MEPRSRHRSAAGLILGEDRVGAIAGIRRLHRPARGGEAIPAKQGTELKDGNGRGHTRVGEPKGKHAVPKPDAITKALDAEQRALLGDLFAVIEEHSSELVEAIDRDEIERAFAFACESHAGQERKSGEDFITHPLGVARICAGLRLDTATLCAALLHDTVEDTSASLDEVRERFGEEIAQLVDGVTKLTEITFKSRDERQAENYRKMMVAMATDVRVILIKLADRLHNMRTLEALPKQKQMEKARETLEIFAPLAHRLGIHAIKWELEDLAFSTLHPRKYEEIKELVAQQRAEREHYVDEAGKFLGRGAEGGRDRRRDLRPRQALLFDLHEDDPQGPGVQRDLRPDRDAGAGRLGQGLLRGDRDHPLDLEAAAGPLQGLHRDAQGQHVPGAAHDGDRARGPAARDPDPHRRRCTTSPSTGSPPTSSTRRARTAAPGDPAKEKMTWLRQLLEAEKDADPKQFLEALKVDLFEDEVFVFTPKGEVKNLSAGSTPLDFAYSVHTDVGHRCVGAKVNGKIVPLHYQLQERRHRRGADREAGPRALARLAEAGPHLARAQQDPRLVPAREPRGRRAPRPRAADGGAEEARPAAAQGLGLAAVRRRDPRDGLPQGRRLLHRPRPVEDLDQGRRQQGDAAPEAGRGAVEEEPAEGLLKGADDARRRTEEATSFGIKVKGVDEVAVRLAKCCRPVPGDEIVGYVSLGRGITVHREDCRNLKALKKAPERITDVHWDGDNEASYRVELQVDAWDRTRLLEDLSRTFAEAGLNILEANCATKHPMVKNRFVVEVGDTEQLKQCISRLRNVDSVFDAYRVTPTG